jgi:uncharacterized membrane protein (UPF0127 family)
VVQFETTHVALPMVQFETAHGALPVVQFETTHGAISVSVEIAETPAARARGLMHRRKLDDHAGMLFWFPAQAHQVFWMKDTLIALDIIFIDASLRVVGVVPDAEPLTETSRQVESPSQYVVEVNGGYCQRHGIGVGTRVVLPGVGARTPAAQSGAGIENRPAPRKRANPESERSAGSSFDPLPGLQP